MWQPSCREQGAGVCTPRSAQPPLPQFPQAPRAGAFSAGDKQPGLTLFANISDPGVHSASPQLWPNRPLATLPAGCAPCHMRASDL